MTTDMREIKETPPFLKSKIFILNISIESHLFLKCI